MDSGAGNRGRRDSNNFAASNERPIPTPANDGGGIPTQQVGGAGPQGDYDNMLSDSSAQAFCTNSRQFPDSSSDPDGLYPSHTPPSADRNPRSAAALEPPVTKATLSELDVNKIVHNPKLRHDINYDPDLHFRPNLDGEKGRRKTQKAAHFWDTLRTQLREYSMDKEQFDPLGTREWCLPATLNAIRGILETLVPQRDRASVEETFNVDLLMQQFRRGVADLVRLAKWLSQLLKCHCAPMRDDWVDEMVSQLSNGDRNGDVNLLVAGMQNLLGVLEAMKLDVANHQIRCLRPILIEDTVHFEQKFFMKKIASGRVDVAGAHAWYKKTSSLPDVVPLDPLLHLQGNTWDFIKGLVNLALPFKAEVNLHSFLFDEERLVKLRTDLLDLINLEICMHLYRNLDNQNSRPARYLIRDDTPTTSYTSSPFQRPNSPANIAEFSSPTIPHFQDFATKAKHATQERGHFFTQPATGRQIWVPTVEDEQVTSAASSPRSSPLSTASMQETRSPTPLYLSAPSPVPDSAPRARAALQAILVSSTASDKWAALSPSIALEILRLTKTPLSRLPDFETHLDFHLSTATSRLYQEAEVRVLAQLFPVLQKLVASYTPMTSLQIFEAATAPKPVTSNPGNAIKDEVSEIATRIAHIGILHWRVWAPLTYLVDPDAEAEGETAMDTARSLP